MKHSNAYMAALKAKDDFLMAGSNREAIDAVNRELHEIKLAIEAEEEQIQRAFEGAAGIRKQMEADIDDPNPRPLLVSKDLIEDMESTRRRMKKEYLRRSREILESAKYKAVVDMYMTLERQVRDEKMKCLIEDAKRSDPRDRPKQPEPAWMIQLDEKNYDLAAATTLDERLFVEKNIRDLADIEANEKRARENQINTNTPSAGAVERARAMREGNGNG